jgi:alcohol dehydrogenase class IV
MIEQFSFAGIPKIIFGAGSFAQIPRIMRGMGRNALIVTGARSHNEAGRFDRLVEELKSNSIRVYHVKVKSEPTPEFVDAACVEHRDKNINVVLGWGGGAAIDAGKAISAMIPQKGPVIDFLEKVGTGARHNGVKAPFIAAPTTSGTGGEATKNAVLRKIGPRGFKNSLRHDSLVPDVAVIDPELMVSCPPEITAACGMDAFSQLLEAYVSTGASPMTDALALGGLECVRDNLVRACTDGARDVNARAGMAYASLMSGIALANAGLGLVHGIAGPLGGFFDIPHGAACGALMSAAFSATIDKLMEDTGGDQTSLRKFAKAGSLFMYTGVTDVRTGCRMIAEKIEELTETLEMPRLGAYGITESDLGKIAAAADNKYNPVKLTAEEIKAVLCRRL